MEGLGNTKEVLRELFSEIEHASLSVIQNLADLCEEQERVIDKCKEKIKELEGELSEMLESDDQ